MSDDDGSAWAPAALAGLLGLCCVSIPVLGGAAAVTGGTAGVTAVASGVSTVGGFLVTFAVTAVTLVPVYFLLRWRYGN